VRIWSAKKALTDGVQEVEADQSLTDGRYFYTDNKWTRHKIGRDCFFSRKEAVERAEKMRLKKIESLEKQLLKLRAMRFE
jgi:hypothetical protein